MPTYTKSPQGFTIFKIENNKAIYTSFYRSESQGSASVDFVTGAMAEQVAANQKDKATEEKYKAKLEQALLAFLKMAKADLTVPGIETAMEYLETKNK